MRLKLGCWFAGLDRDRWACLANPCAGDARDLALLVRRAVSAAVAGVARRQFDRWLRGEISLQALWDRSWSGGDGAGFLDPGELVDGDLRLVLAATNLADDARGLVAEYRYTMWSDSADAEVGWISLRLGLTEALRRYGGHVGYGVDEPFRGRRYATRSCRLLFPLARAHGIDPLLITPDVDNVASRRTCERIGGRLVDEARVEFEPGVWRETCYYHVQLEQDPPPGAMPGLHRSADDD